jgi:hypothetical protein
MNRHRNTLAALLCVGLLAGSFTTTTCAPAPVAVPWPVLDAAEPIPDAPVATEPDSFTFVRVRYESSGGYGESWYHYEGRDWQRWETDYPRAELNLLFRLNELTSIRVNPQPIVLRLTDDALFDYPFIFMSDVGWQVLSRAERTRLKQYLNRGGFLWIDDFWGNAEWANLLRNTQAISSQWSWRPLPAGHPILKAVYPMQQCPQIPARIFFESRRMAHDPHWVHRQPAGGDAGVSTVRLMGLFSEQGRLLAVATHNTDIADGWEREGEDREYFERFSINSYAMAINILVYAFTN